MPADSVMVLMNIAEMAILGLLFADADEEGNGDGRQKSTNYNSDGKYLQKEEGAVVIVGGPLRALLLAAHVFLYIIMRQVAKDKAVARALTHRLEKSLRPWRQQDLGAWENCLPALLWALFVGAAAAPAPVALAQENEQHWIWWRLRELCGVMQLDSKKSLLDVLQRFLWIDERCTPRLDEFLSLALLTGEFDDASRPMRCR